MEYPQCQSQLDLLDGAVADSCGGGNPPSLLGIGPSDGCLHPQNSIHGCDPLLSVPHELRAFWGQRLLSTLPGQLCFDFEVCWWKDARTSRRD